MKVLILNEDISTRTSLGEALKKHYSVKTFVPILHLNSAIELAVELMRTEFILFDLFESEEINSIVKNYVGRSQKPLMIVGSKEPQKYRDFGFQFEEKMFCRWPCPMGEMFAKIDSIAAEHGKVKWVAS